MLNADRVESVNKELQTVELKLVGIGHSLAQQLKDAGLAGFVDISLGVSLRDAAGDLNNNDLSCNRNLSTSF